ncbi:hypothetical protein F0562_030853 [Nyssa sinensis]|uniref:Uncharacterized protein n=1 Tax=Nyssa sinensis TaxID=561372 RepID=A0A5J5B211_9ASTE|nr:hypothetical protein F0562_030853 [Nyssa sinensis]
MLGLLKTTPSQGKESVPPTGGVAKDTEGVNFPRPAVVINVGEFHELIQSAPLFKRKSVLDAAFLSSRVFFSPGKATTESPLSISSDDSPNITSVKGILGGFYHTSSGKRRLKKKRAGKSFVAEGVQLTSSTKRVKISSSFHESSRKQRDYPVKFKYKLRENHVCVRDDGQASEREAVLIEVVLIGDTQEVATTQSVSIVEAALGKAEGDVVFDNSVLSEPAVPVNVTTLSTCADDVEENMGRVSHVVLPAFKGVTNVHNDSPILPLIDLDSDEDSSPTTVET